MRGVDLRRNQIQIGELKDIITPTRRKPRASLFKQMLAKNRAVLGYERPYRSNTAAHAGLRLAFCRRRHEVIARTFGISPAQRR